MLYIPSNGGVKLAVNDLNRAGSKTVLLVHGWPLSQRQWDYTIPALIEQDCRVVTFDLAGFGDSDSPASGYNYDQFAEDLFNIVRALQLDNFTLCGFSMGGAICVRYLAKYAQGASKLVLLDAAVPSYCKNRTNPHGQPVGDTDKLIQMGWNDRPALNEYFGSIFFEQEHSEPFKQWFQGVSDSASQMGEMLSLVALRDEDCYSDLQHVWCPTLIIHGKQDKICPFGMAEIVRDRVDGARLVPVQSAGHGAFYEQRERVNKALVEFIGYSSQSNA